MTFISANFRLMGTGGYARCRLLDDDGVARLRAEAWASAPSAIPTKGPRYPGQLWYGKTDFWFSTAPGGEVLTKFVGAKNTCDSIAEITGVPVVPTGEDAQYMYFDHPSHYLGLHLDHPDAEVALITCVHQDPGPAAVVLYPDRCDEPLAAIAESPDVGAVRIRLAVGESLVFCASVIPHSITATGGWHSRVLVINAYQGVATP